MALDGRSHWPEAGFLWVAGGGLTTGQVIGATDARGEHVVGTPITMQNVLATLYRVLGIDPAVTPELALATISSLHVLGALHASPAVKAALARRRH